MLSFKKVITASLLMLSVLSFGTVQAATELKFATLAPKGSSLYKGLQKVSDQIAKDTQGRVKLNIFAGGVAGDEKDVVRKIRYGQLHGAALTGVGLGLIDPQVRVLELPFLFKDQATVDKAYVELRPYFKSAFASKGFQLLGWAEVGFVNIFSNKPIKSISDLKGMKMWMWEGDPLAKAMYDAMGVTPVPLAITDVLTSLQTNLIDGAYAPPLGAIAFQWHTKTKYVTDVNLVNGTGGLVVSNQAWDKISAADRKTIESIITQASTQLTADTRRENAESKSILGSAGLKIITPAAKDIEEMQVIGLKVQKSLVGQLYSQDLLNKVLAITK